MVCGVLTSAGPLDSDPFSKQYKTRTDSGVDTIRRTPWFTLPLVSGIVQRLMLFFVAKFVLVNL